jgi:hypothetical protein
MLLQLLQRFQKKGRCFIAIQSVQNRFKLSKVLLTGF